MTEKFKNDYRIESTRLQAWNYAWPGTYFITICTQDRKPYFGKIENGKIQLSELGIAVETEWLKTPGIRPDMNLELDAFVVMPNHFHAILVIGENEYNQHRGRDAMHCVSTAINKFAPQSKNLSSIVRGFKSSITTYARKHDIAFQWQERFYDHIIRNDESYHRIKNYIATNPQNWETDTLKV
jgi:putative transposase